MEKEPWKIQWKSRGIRMEQVHPLLVKTKARGPARFDELMGHKHIANGPTHACLYP
jgi:hypothetical protein